MILTFPSTCQSFISSLVSVLLCYQRIFCLPADSSVPSLPDSAAWCNTNRLMTNEPFDLTCPARWICFWVLSTSVKQWATARQSVFAYWRWLCLSLTSCLNQPVMCKHSLFLTKHVFFCVMIHWVSGQSLRMTEFLPRLQLKLHEKAFLM